MKTLATLLLCLAFAAGPLAGPALATTIIRGPVAHSKYLIYTDCENGLPSGWTSSGTVDTAYTTSPLQGSFSWKISAGGYVETPAFPAQATVWAFVLFRKDTQPSTNNAAMVAFRGGGSAVGYFASRTDLTHRVYNGATSQGGGNLANTTNHSLWLYYAAGNGADGVTTAWVATGSETKPGSSYQTVTGTATASATTFRITAPTGCDLVVDKIIVSIFDPGSNP
jgi:hypothetical protein